MRRQIAERERRSLVAESKNQLPSLDGIRAACIVLVLGSHAARGVGFPDRWQFVAEQIFSGSLGVLVFFVLSGFLITYLLAKEEAVGGRICLRSFYLRRAIRILPVFIVFLLAMGMVDAMTALKIPKCNYLTAITMTKNMGCANWIDGHLWSLSVEEQFYLLWPAVFFCGKGKWRAGFALAMIISAPLFRVWFYLLQYDMRQFATPSNMDALMIGSVTGYFVAVSPATARRLVSIAPSFLRCVAVIMLFGTNVLQMHGLFGRVLVPFGVTIQSGSAVFLVASYALNPCGLGYAILNWRPIAYLGVLSYSIYIWQQPFFSQPVDLGWRSAGILAFPFNILSAISVAMLSFHFIEKPLLKLRARFRLSTAMQ
jgi:peptidoglycan/LPS O-acetylase OafA/YrhL